MIDYFASHLWQLWALVSFICLILELTNGDFFIMCFAIGGVCAAIASALGVGFYGGLLVWLVRPTALKYLHKNADERVSNADALMGRIGRVSETIEAEGYGRVAIDGDDWKAVSANGGRIEKGANVKVVGRDSIIITVEPA